MKRLACAISALFILAACKEPKTDRNEAMLMPKPPPPPVAEVPASLHIPVEIDGRAADPIDAKKLGARKADFQDNEHRAWRMADLIGAPADRSDTVFTIVGDSNFRVTMPHPKKAGDLVPVLMLSRRSEITAAMVKPDDPFPAYHGQGRRLERGGDPLPRVAKSVAKILVTYDANAVASTKADGTPQEVATPAIEISLDGKPTEAWTLERIKTVETKKVPSGDAARESWSLRDLAHALVGPKARVVAVAGAGHRKLAIDPKAWDDPRETPALRVNRQGLFKFQWVGDRTKLAAEAELRNVHALELESGR
jgi:hypothetical protein